MKQNQFVHLWNAGIQAREAKGAKKVRSKFSKMLGCGLLLASTHVLATPITATLPFHLLDNVGDNSIRTQPGLRQQFGAQSVIPNGDNGTTGVATQGASTATLVHTPFDTAPNFFSTSRAANTVPDGSWTLTFQNGADTAVANTPTIAGATVVPFASTMSITPGVTPTFNWVVPSTFTPDRVRIQIRENNDLRGTGGVGGAGVANIIYQQGFAGNTTSFTVNPSDPAFTTPGGLAPNRLYSFELQLLDLRNAAGGIGNANVLSRSRTFFDFTLLPNGAPSKVFLPTLVPGSQPYYQFNIAQVTAGQTIYIDPLVAVGYNYQKGANDPNFRSVILPTGIGDNLFDLYEFDLGTGDYMDTGIDLVGGTEFLFGPNGVDRFSIRGIETSAGLDPADVTAFVTGVSFVADGQFTGTMTPIIVNVPAAVPLPGTLALFALGLLGLHWNRKKIA